MTTSIPARRLNDGAIMPQLGLGVWQASEDDTRRIVRYAIDDAGYRSIDTAAVYGNEAAVGRAVRDSGVAREDLFVTTKLWNAAHGRDRALDAFDSSLKALNMDYVDLYLIHWPLRDEDRLVRTWEALVEIQRAGKARSIGVSNFEPHHLELLAAHSDVVPAVNQVELHPRLQQRALREYAADRGIAVESWSPLGGSGKGWDTSRPNSLLADPVLKLIAADHNKSVAQVIIRWHLQNGLIVIPKSVRNERVSENADVFDFELDTEAMAAISALDSSGRIGAHPDELDFGAPTD